MRNGEHDTWTKDGVTYYKFDYQLADGTRGDAMSKSPQGQFQVGAEVEYKYTPATDPRYAGRISMSDPNRASRTGSGGASWSPERKAEVMTQGMIHAAVTGGAKTELDIVNLVYAQMAAYKQAYPNILKYVNGPQPAAQAAPADQAQPPAPPAAPAPPARPLPPPPNTGVPAPAPLPQHQQPVAVSPQGEDDLPF